MCDSRSGSVIKSRITNHESQKFSRPCQVLARVCADANHVAGIDERRHADDEPRLERCRLDLVAGGRALDARHRVEHLEVDGLRQLDADRLGPIELDVDGHLRLQVVHRLAERLAVDVDLFVGRGVHEIIVFAVLIQVLHLALVERRALHRVLGPQLLISQRSAANVPELHADKTAQVARGDVLELEDPEQVLLHLDEHPFFQTRRLYSRHVSPPSIPNGYARFSVMAFARWDPIRDLLAIQQRLDRFAPAPTGWIPPIDVHETAEEYVITAELPGLGRDDVEIKVLDGRLQISGERRERDLGCEQYHRVERGRGSFSRTFELPHPVEEERVTADLHDGVLTVVCPKAAEG